MTSRRNIGGDGPAYTSSSFSSSSFSSSSVCSSSSNCSVSSLGLSRSFYVSSSSRSHSAAQELCGSSSTRKSECNSNRNSKFVSKNSSVSFYVPSSICSASLPSACVSSSSSPCASQSPSCSSHSSFSGTGRSSPVPPDDRPAFRQRLAHQLVGLALGALHPSSVLRPAESFREDSCGAAAAARISFSPAVAPARPASASAACPLRQAKGDKPHIYELSHRDGAPLSLCRNGDGWMWVRILKTRLQLLSKGLFKEVPLTTEETDALDSLLPRERMLRERRTYATVYAQEYECELDSALRRFALDFKYSWSAKRRPEILELVPTRAKYAIRRPPKKIARARNAPKVSKSSPMSDGGSRCRCTCAASLPAPPALTFNEGDLDDRAFPLCERGVLPNPIHYWRLLEYLPMLHELDEYVKICFRNGGSSGGPGAEELDDLYYCAHDDQDMSNQLRGEILVWVEQMGHKLRLSSSTIRLAWRLWDAYARAVTAADAVKDTGGGGAVGDGPVPGLPELSAALQGYAAPLPKRLHLPVSQAARHAGPVHPLQRQEARAPVLVRTDFGRRISRQGRY
eukprot:GHVT01070298.1.p1 GENE.GHVT01070298.1~~GHVT01070298.1.p1  ORF type:complete len:569 (+),score=127.43 GHVT01070298.1:926-2632(+)